LTIGDFDVYTQNQEINRSKLAGLGRQLKHFISAKTPMFRDVFSKTKTKLQKVPNIKSAKECSP